MPRISSAWEAYVKSTTSPPTTPAPAPMMGPVAPSPVEKAISRVNS